MVPRKGVLKGSKVSKQHSTYNSVAERVIVALKPVPEVNKIVLGPIRQLSGGERRVTVREDRGQAKVQCRDIGSVQVLWVIGADVSLLKSVLEASLDCDVK